MSLLSKNFFVVLLFLLLSSCSKKNTFDDSLPEKIEITSMIFSKELNPSLLEDVTLEEDSNGVFSAKLPKYINKELILTYYSNALQVMVNGASFVSGVSVVDFSNPVKITLVGKNNRSRDIQIKGSWFDVNIPHISINIDGEQEITSKSNYLQADISIDGNELYPDYHGKTEIRGRGNSTWSYPKKPFRLKLNQKAEILGLPAAKNWVLLANYMDPMLMCNAVAMKMGRDLGVPFTNHIIPVDLTMNGQYRGSYVLTEQVEVGENRVNIGEDGYLFELDSYFDEEYQFRSSTYSLPIMIKHPDLKSQEELFPIQAEFQNFENLISDTGYPNNNPDIFDVNSFAKYFIVYFLSTNQEINHPKSIYLHKAKGGKYRFGPIWDFDWAYGYEPGIGYFTNSTRSLLGGGDAIGDKFFSRLVQNNNFKTALKSTWRNYKDNEFKKLFKFIDEYQALIKKSKDMDELIWKSGKSLDLEVPKLKRFLETRAATLDLYVAGF